MFRKTKTHISYNKNNVQIRSASLDEEYEVGRWCLNYPWIKIGYQYEEYKSKYSDITYVMVLNNEIIGYFMAFNEINIGSNIDLPLYSKELILYDFAVDTKAYSKYSKILINYLVQYAKNDGYNVITIHKEEKYNRFNNFVRKNVKVKETENKIYILIENPKIRSCQKYLTVYENDSISIEELYFLYDLNFDILKTKSKLKLNDNEEIVINRSTGEILFPKRVNLIQDKVILNSTTKSLVFLIVSMYYMDDMSDITILYDVNNPKYYEANIDGLLYVSKTLKELKNDNDYINILLSRGIEHVVTNELKYTMNERSFSDSKVKYKLTK